MLQRELAEIDAYLKLSLKREIIKESKLLAASSILFASKANKGLRFCVDYWQLNSITRKDRYSLLLISKLRDCLQEATIFTKLNQQAAFTYVRIKERDK